MIVYNVYLGLRWEGNERVSEFTEGSETPGSRCQMMDWKIYCLTLLKMTIEKVREIVREVKPGGGAGWVGCLRLGWWVCSGVERSHDRTNINKREINGIRTYVGRAYECEKAGKWMRGKFRIVHHRLVMRICEYEGSASRTHVLCCFRWGCNGVQELVIRWDWLQVLGSQGVWWAHVGQCGGVKQSKFGGCM